MARTNEEVALRPELRETPSRWDKASLAEIEARLEELVGQRRPDLHAPSPEPPTDLPGGRHSGRLLGNLLVTRGHLVDRELQYALDVQKKTAQRLGEIVVDLGLVSEHDLCELLAEQHGIDVVNLRRGEIESEIVRLMPADVLRRAVAAPFRRRRAWIDVAIADPTDTAAISDLASALGRDFRLHVALRAEILDVIDRFGR